MFSIHPDYAIVGDYGEDICGNVYTHNGVSATIHKSDNNSNTWIGNITFYASDSAKQDYLKKNVLSLFLLQIDTQL